jgi:hypothetical protein
MDPPVCDKYFNEVLYGLTGPVQDPQATCPDSRVDPVATLRAE